MHAKTCLRRKRSGTVSVSVPCPLRIPTVHAFSLYAHFEMMSGESSVDTSELRVRVHSDVCPICLEDIDDRIAYRLRNLHAMSDDLTGIVDLAPDSAQRFMVPVVSEPQVCGVLVAVCSRDGPLTCVTAPCGHGCHASCLLRLTMRNAAVLCPMCRSALAAPDRPGEASRSRDGTGRRESSHDDADEGDRANGCPCWAKFACAVACATATLTGALH